MRVTPDTQPFFGASGGTPTASTGGMSRAPCPAASLARLSAITGGSCARLGAGPVGIGAIGGGGRKGVTFVGGGAVAGEVGAMGARICTLAPCGTGGGPAVRGWGGGGIVLLFMAPCETACVCAGARAWPA